MRNFNEKIEKAAQTFNKAPIFDGVVNEQEYLNAKVKILWILRDANSTGEEESYDLREAINDLKTDSGIRKGWANTFAKIVYVTNGIINNKSWDEIPYYYDNPEIVSELKKIAYINVKKVGGGARSLDVELQEHYNKTKDLLFGQFQEFNPDMFIFGGTYKLFRNDLNLETMKNFGTCNAISKEGKIYIDAMHPSARIKQEIYMSDILNAYKNLNRI